MILDLDGSSPINKEAGLKEAMIRLLYQCKRSNFHHLGSAFATLPTVHEIYSELRATDKVVLSNGHAAAALYVELERYHQKDSSSLFNIMGDHPHLDPEWGIHCSTGSLGMGITVAVGLALAEKNISVHCIVSDGECAEGSTWEAIRFAKAKKLKNLKIYVIANGWSGYDSIDVTQLESQIKACNDEVLFKREDNFPFDTKGLSAHYLQLDEELYQIAKERICEKYS